MSLPIRFSNLLRTLQSISRLPSITMAAPRIFSRCPRALSRLGYQRSSWATATRHQRRKIFSFPKNPPQNERSWRPLVAWSVTGVLSYGILEFMSEKIPVSLDAPSIATLDDRTKRETAITSSSPMRLRMEKLIKDHQKKIVEELSRIDGKSFIIDEWNRPDGGGGISCVLQDGNVFEKAGVNVSVVYGQLPRPAIEKMRADHKSFVGTDVESLDFFAAGLSLVLHPKNPMAPTVHLNYRYFETSDPKDPLHGPKNWWFGGGTDLTPSYIFPEDCKHFHQTIKETCDKHDPSYYPKFKKWCDDYFYIPHRHEARGIGGIFFDDLDAEFLRHSTSHSSTNPQETLFSFVSDALASFLPAYIPIIERRKDMPFTQAEKDWQQQRRGRYVEFNLVYDRGTSFGLRTPSARVESILMSLPRTAEWVYMDPISGTKMGEEKKVPGEEVGGEEKKRERELINVLKYPREWA